MTTVMFNATVSSQKLIDALELSFRASRLDYSSTMAERKKQVLAVSQNWQSWQYERVCAVLEGSGVSSIDFERDLQDVKAALFEYARVYQSSSVGYAVLNSRSEPEMLRKMTSVAMDYLTALMKFIIRYPEMTKHPKYLTLFGVKEVEEVGGSSVLPYTRKLTRAGQVTSWLVDGVLTVRTDLNIRQLADEELQSKMRTAEVEWYRKKHESEHLDCLGDIGNRIPEQFSFKLDYSVPVEVQQGSLLMRIAFAQKRLSVFALEYTVEEFMDHVARNIVKSKTPRGMPEKTLYLEVLYRFLKQWQQIADNALKLVRNKDGSVTDMYPVEYLKEQYAKLRKDFNTKFPDLVVTGSLTLG